MRQTGCANRVALFCLLGVLMPVTLTAGPRSPADRAVLAPIDSLWNGWSRTEAMESVEEALPLARARSDSALLAQLLWRQGSFRIATGDLRQARGPLLEAMHLAESLADTSALAPALRWLALTDPGPEGAAATRKVLERLVTIATATDDRHHLGWANVGIGYRCWVDGDGEGALRHYETALEHFTAIDEVEGVLWSNNGIAMIRSDRGEYAASLVSYQAVAERARRENLPAAEATAVNNLGYLEYSLGRPDAALQHFEAARSIFRNLGRRQAQATPLQNIALCRTTLGQTNAALLALQEALQIGEEVGSALLRARAHIKIADALSQQGLVDDARDHYLAALSDSLRLQVNGRADIHRGLAELHRSQGDQAAALVELRAAEDLLLRTENNYQLLQVRGTIGRVMAAADQFDDAIEVFHEVTTMARATGTPEFVVDGLAGLGATYFEAGHGDSAIVYYSAAAAAWEQERRLPLSPEWREQRGTRGRRIFPDLVYLLWTNGRPQEAWDRLQAFKGRTLLERMLGPGRPYDTALANVSAHAVVSLAELQREILNPGELLLDYALGPDRSLVIAVTCDSLRFAELPGEEALQAALRSFHALLSDPGSGSAAGLGRVGRSMAARILGELEPWVAAHERVIVIPDGAVNLAPFSALAIDGPRWSRAPSASILRRVRPRGLEQQDNQAPWTTLGYAGRSGPGGLPLPGAQQEIERLAGRFHGVTQVSRLRDAEGRLTGALGGVDILHLAAHAENDDQSPWQSSIDLDDDEDRGRWRAQEIAGQDLETRLVVLSSCSSVGGRILSGEGFMGLTAAFFTAGVPTVVASLWQVDDAVTGDFMVEFYAAMAAGQDVAGALTQARQVIRSRQATAHPYYWAGFVATGEGRLQPVLGERRGVAVRRVIAAGFGVIILGALLWVPPRRA